MMELETVNKLYLELSQFATAKTAKDAELDKVNEEVKKLRKVILQVFNDDAFLGMTDKVKDSVSRVVNNLPPAPEGGDK